MTALVVLEGIDGAGTTTQARRLVERLVASGRAAHLTREPSDGPVGRLLREMLAGAHAPVDRTTLGLLFAADRADHLQREVEPALARGELVVSDRYLHSSLAYQADPGERDWVAAINQRARRADLAILLEVDPEVAARRRADAGRDEEIFDQLDTQRRVAANYRAVFSALAAAGDERAVVLDGELGPGEVADAIWREVEKLWAPRG